MLSAAFDHWVATVAGMTEAGPRRAPPAPMPKQTAGRRDGFWFLAAGGVAGATSEPQAVVEFDERVLRPKPLPDLVSSDDLTGPV
jgi:hypothetical protein